MTTGPGDEERTWTAEKRDFVAEWRDGVADARDAIADARERAANAREAFLDRWEEKLAQRAAALGAPPEDASDETLDEAMSRRQEAAVERERAEHDRDRESASRDQATERRRSDEPTMLAKAFATITEQLYDADTVDDVLLRIAQAAVSSVAGCGMASVTLAEPQGPRTAATTHVEAATVDHAQYEAGEGPSLDAITTPLVYVSAFPDERYPRLGARPVAAGVHSAVSYHLSARSPASADPVEGSLNAYGMDECAFDDAAREIGLVLAAHASIAARAVGRRASLEKAGQELREALMSRDVIGQAKGMLMERLQVTPDDAFDMLRRASQQLNVKLRQVAETLTETGKLDR